MNSVRQQQILDIYDHSHSSENFSSSETRIIATLYQITEMTSKLFSETQWTWKETSRRVVLWWCTWHISVKISYHLKHEKSVIYQATKLTSKSFIEIQWTWRELRCEQSFFDETLKSLALEKIVRWTDCWYDEDSWILIDQRKCSKVLLDILQTIARRLLLSIFHSSKSFMTRSFAFRNHIMYESTSWSIT